MAISINLIKIKERYHGNLINRKFYNLKVLDKANNIGSARGWLCECKCGKKIIATTTYLIRGHTKSCGCFRITNAKKQFTLHGQARGRKRTREYSMWCHAKERSRKFNVPFNIQVQDIVIPEYCPVFKNLKLEFNKNKNGPNSPSLDRIIPQLGYVKENICVISLRANQIKNNGTVDDLKAVTNWLENIILVRSRKNDGNL